MSCSFVFDASTSAMLACDVAVLAMPPLAVLCALCIDTSMNVGAMHTGLAVVLPTLATRGCARLRMSCSSVCDASTSAVLACGVAVLAVPPLAMMWPVHVCLSLFSCVQCWGISPSSHLIFRRRWRHVRLLKAAHRPCRPRALGAANCGTAASPRGRRCQATASIAPTCLVLVLT